MTHHGKSHPGFLPTTPATAVVWEGKWCAGHPWSARGPVRGFLHRAGHRARLLRLQGPATPLVYLDLDDPREGR